MPRLFVAIDLPDDVKRELRRIRPEDVRGVRLTKPDQMHVTLHFLVNAELEPTREAVRTVAAPAFSLAMEGVGTFGSPRRGLILWAGFQVNAALSALHAALAQALAPTGYVPEPRPFSPHITLARCEPQVPRRVIDAFLEKNVQFALPEFPVSEFVLYSSELTRDGSVYRREEIISLTK